MSDKNIGLSSLGILDDLAKEQECYLDPDPSASNMKFGVCVPNYGDSSSTEALRAVASEAERSGCDSVWTTDHILMSTNSGTPYEKIFDSINTLAYLAGITDKVRLGISSLITAMRNPVIVAKQLATIDNLSGGRIMLATSAGWNEREFGNIGSDFHTRGRRLDASIRLIRALWRGETSFKSRGLRMEFGDAVFDPKPVQKHLTMWIGGTSKFAMKRAVSLGDGWHPNVQPIEQFTKLVQDFREVSPDAKTKPICVRIGINPRAEKSEYRSPQGEPRIMLSGNIPQNEDIVSSLEALGVAYVVGVPSPDGRVSVSNQVDAVRALSKLLR